MKIKNITIEERVSKKTGKPYKMLVITTESGYQCELFLSNEQAFCLTH